MGFPDGMSDGMLHGMLHGMSDRRSDQRPRQRFYRKFDGMIKQMLAKETGQKGVLRDHEWMIHSDQTNCPMVIWWSFFLWSSIWIPLQTPFSPYIRAGLEQLYLATNELAAAMKRVNIDHNHQLLLIGNGQLAHIPLQVIDLMEKVTKEQSKESTKTNGSFFGSWSWTVKLNQSWAQKLVNKATYVQISREHIVKV